MLSLSPRSQDGTFHSGVDAGVGWDGEAGVGTEGGSAAEICSPGADLYLVAPWRVHTGDTCLALGLIGGEGTNPPPRNVWFPQRAWRSAPPVPPRAAPSSRLPLS